MRIASTEALHPPLVFRSEFAPASTPARRAALAERSVAAQHGNDELPDPAFWTAYDYFMLEREARSVRRAFIWSLVTDWTRRLRGAAR